MLAELYRLTPMEDTFCINNVALVDGQPLILGLQGTAAGLPRAPLRRGPSPLGVPAHKAQDRLHLVDGLMIALLNIDEVIQVIRTSDDAAAAPARG